MIGLRGKRGLLRGRRCKPRSGYFPPLGPGKSLARLLPHCSGSRYLPPSVPISHLWLCPGQTLLPMLPTLRSRTTRPATRTVNMFRHSCCSGETQAVPCLVTSACGRRHCCCLEWGCGVPVLGRALPLLLHQDVQSHCCLGILIEQCSACCTWIPRILSASSFRDGRPLFT